MSYPSLKILNPPTPDILKDEKSHYKLLLELYNRSGGFTSNSADLKGLTASVQELNTLEGIKLDDTVQEQLNSKIGIGSLGTMSLQNANNVKIIGGELENVQISSCAADNLIVSGGQISGAQITTPTGSSAYALSNGVIFDNYVTVGNVGVTETNLMTYNLLANTLLNNSFIEIIGFGSFAANANNKQLKLILGATTIYDSTLLALNSGFWKINCIICSISSNIEKCVSEISSSNTLLQNNINYIQTTENLSLDLSILFTGTGINDNDIVQEGMIIKYYKG